MIKKISYSYIRYEKPKSTVIFYATFEEEVIGSCILYEVNYFTPLVGIEVGMTRVLKSFRNKGIAQKLLGEAVSKLKPDVICGATNNPTGVLYRSKVCARRKMRTFFGHFDITNNKYTANNAFVNSVMFKYLKAKKDANPNNLVFYINRRRLSPKIPDLNGYPAFLNEAFKTLAKKQKIVGLKKTAVLPLINIREALLK